MSAAAATAASTTTTSTAATAPAGTRRPVCLIDASIYIYRAWQTWPPDTRDPCGRPAAAVAGFADTLAGLLTLERPAHVACAFDTCGRTGARNALYPPYKRSRPPTSPVLVEQIGRCMALSHALGVVALGSASVEADDIVGQMAALARRSGERVTIVSGDKDLAQHVAAGDSYWDVGRHARQDVRALERRLGVRPAQVPDWLALSGDGSDDIPGVPGVGPATAARLLRKWGSLEVLFAHLGKVASMRFRGAPRVAALLAEHEGTVRLARRLTGLIEDPSLPATLEAIRRRPLPAHALHAALIDAGLDAACAAAHARALGAPTALA